MRYITVEASDVKRMANLVNERAAQGWRLVGPVLPVACYRRPTTYLATMEQTIKTLVEEVAQRRALRRFDSQAGSEETPCTRA